MKKFNWTNYIISCELYSTKQLECIEELLPDNIKKNINWHEIINNIKQRRSVIKDPVITNWMWYETIQPSHRPRLAKWGGFYTPGASDNKKKFKLLMEDELFESPKTPMSGQLHLSLGIFIPLPKAKSKDSNFDLKCELGVIRPVVHSFGDCDNLYKALTDCIPESILENDAHIVSTNISKWFSSFPRIEYTWYQLDKDEKEIDKYL